MSGPEQRRREERCEPRPGESPAVTPPPGYFLSDDLASDTARFLDEVKRRVARGETRDDSPPRPPR